MARERAHEGSGVGTETVWAAARSVKLQSYVSICLPLVKVDRHRSTEPPGSWYRVSREAWESKQPILTVD